MAGHRGHQVVLGHMLACFGAVQDAGQQYLQGATGCSGDCRRLGRALGKADRLNGG